MGFLEKFLQSLFVVSAVLIVSSAEAEEKPTPVDSELVREVDSGDSPKLSRIYRFKDDLDSCRWVVAEKSREPFDLILDTHLVSASTVAPLETGLVVGNDLVAEEEKPVEARYQLKKPEGDRPVSYLFRLWRKRQDGEMLVDTFFLRLEPRGILEDLRGLKVFLHDPDGELKWIDPLREAGIRVKTLEQSQPGDSGKQDVLLIFNDIEQSGENLQFQKIGSWKRIIRLDRYVADREEISVRKEPGGWVLTMHPSLLDNLEKDPEWQRQLVEWILEGPEPGEE